MARVYGPIFGSADARGKLGNVVVFMAWKGANTVRIWAKPYNPQSASQVAQRTLFTGGVKSYQAQDAAMITSWDTYADKISTAVNPLSGFNAYVREYINTGDHPGSPPA